METAKPFEIPKKLVLQAYRKVKANGGSAGVDQQSIVDFEQNLKDNLYRIWNRMSSGSYFPPAVKAVGSSSFLVGNYANISYPFKSRNIRWNNDSVLNNP